MADASDGGEEKAHEASARLQVGLKSCRKVVDSYSAMLRQQQQPVDSRDEKTGKPR